MSDPYVVSQDIFPLLAAWTEKKGLCLPADVVETARKELYAVLRKTFSEVIIVDENELTEGINRLVRGVGLTPISLDGVYCVSRYHLDLSRQVDARGDDRDIGPRYGQPTIIQQVQTVAEQLREVGESEVVLVDDVVFSGKLLLTVKELLAQFGIIVKRAVAGVLVGNGADQVRQRGIEVQAVCRFERVLDEVCERDFIPGVPRCGRTVTPFGRREVGLPYLLPFGRPSDWATVPRDEEVGFSKACLAIARDLYEAIGVASSRVVRCLDWERLPGELPPGCEDETIPASVVLEKYIETF